MTTTPTTAVIPVPRIDDIDNNDESDVYNDHYIIEYDDSDDDYYHRNNSHHIEPYVPKVAPVIVQPPIKNQSIPSLPPLSHNDLLERARQNSEAQSRQPVVNNNELPAFRRLMETGIRQLKTGELSAAESSFTRAQRIAPKSSAVYFYLAQVALQKNQPRKAEAMARRGLSVSQDISRQRALWQIILRSAQLQNSPRVISEAQQALR